MDRRKRKGSFERNSNHYHRRRDRGVEKSPPRRHRSSRSGRSQHLEDDDDDDYNRKRKRVAIRRRSFSGSCSRSSSSISSRSHSRGRSRKQKRRSDRRHGRLSRRSRDNSYRRRDDRSRSLSVSEDERKKRKSRFRSRSASGSVSRSRQHIEKRPDDRRHDRHNRDDYAYDRNNNNNNRPIEENRGFAERRQVDYRRSYSTNREWSRRRRRGQRHRRSRSLSSFSSSSSSQQPRIPPRPRGAAALPTSRAGVVSDDDEMLGHMSGGPSNRRATARNLGRNDSRRAANARNNKRKRDSAQSSSQTQDDTVGHFWGGPGTIVANTYRVERELGVGTFGRVVECLDLSKHRGAGGGGGSNQRHQRDDDNNLVAIKMVRKVKRYYESALIEADIVNDVNRRGGPRGRGTSHFAVMYDAFNFRGHYCLVFESLGPSLYDYLKRNKYQPFPINYIRDFSVQLLEAIEFLHSFKLIHTDLKPENILVTKCREISCGYQKLPESTRIKVIDFGGATYDDEKKSSVVNTRQYRAPEVILGCGWSMPSDLWSAGCILAELYQGELLFATHDNLEHLALIEWIIGPFPRRMLQKANQLDSSLAIQAFDSKGRHRMHGVLAPENASYVLSMPPLESAVRKKKDEWFLKLLRSILVIDPESRSSARDALRTSFG